MTKKDDLRFERVADWPGLIYRSTPLKIPGLPGERQVSLYLPPDYFKSQQAYPLAVFFDGQNLFEDEGTMAGGWHLHRCLDQRAEADKPVPIVAGIHHGDNRDEEMAPWPALPGQTPRAEDKLSWIREWLVPRLQTKLQIQPGPHMVGGSSLGGFLALYAVMSQPDFYQRALVMSPALWVHNFEIFPWLMLHFPKETPLKIYLDHGKKEGDEMYGNILFNQSQLLADLLEILGLKPNEDYLWYPDPEGAHNEQSWSRRLPQAFDFLWEGVIPNGKTHRH